LVEVDYPTIPPALHICETFNPSDECDVYDADLIQTIILGFRHHSFIYPNKYPKLPLPVSYTSPRASMDSIHHFIVETDIGDAQSWLWPWAKFGSGMATMWLKL
jgi:hypothetical protein